MPAAHLRCRPGVIQLPEVLSARYAHPGVLDDSVQGKADPTKRSQLQPHRVIVAGQLLATWQPPHGLAQQHHQLTDV